MRDLGSDSGKGHSRRGGFVSEGSWPRMHCRVRVSPSAAGFTQCCGAAGGLWEVQGVVGRRLKPDGEEAVSSPVRLFCWKKHKSSTFEF